MGWDQKYSDQSGWRSSSGHQDGCSVRGVLEKDVIKIMVEEGGVFAQEGDEMKARVEKELFLPSGWMASPGRCRWRT